MMEMMDLFEIKRNPNVGQFEVKKGINGDWNIYFYIDTEKHIVKTKRGVVRNFKTLDNVAIFVEKCGKCSDFRVFI